MLIDKVFKTISPGSDYSESTEFQKPASWWPHEEVDAQQLTFTLKSLSHYPPEQGATVITERWHFVVVDAELVRDVDSEPLLSDLYKGNRGKS